LQSQQAGWGCLFFDWSKPFGCNKEDGRVSSACCHAIGRRLGECCQGEDRSEEHGILLHPWGR
jgi:hypothetical protein